MSSLLICKAIDCPFWSDGKVVDGKSLGNYGCQRYRITSACHLAHTRSFESNEYALYTEKSLDVDGLKRENDAFFLEDAYYSKQRKFFESFPDLARSSFVPREIH